MSEQGRAVTQLLKGSVILFFLLSTQTLALPQDIAQPMQITADTTSFDYKSGTGTYDGNVVVTQGKTRLTADRLMTWNNPQHKIQKAIAYGLKKPAQYVTYLNVNDGYPLQAEAGVIRFYPFRALVILEDHAKVRHGEDLFEGPVAVYDMKKQTVNAPLSAKGPAKILIQPDRISS